jgi:hypothetical protein
MIDQWLARLAWIAVLSLPFLAVWAGRIAMRHSETAARQRDAGLRAAQASRLLKILELVEQPSVREARHSVMTAVRRLEEAGTNWWESDDGLHRAAAQVCAAYHDLGGIINFDASDRVGQYVLEQWGEDLIRAHEVLQRFLLFRRDSGGDSYREFTWLFEEAKLLHRGPPAA